MKNNQQKPLSEKSYLVDDMYEDRVDEAFLIEDVKEAVKRLKDNCQSCFDAGYEINFDWLLNEIDKIFGEELTK